MSGTTSISISSALLQKAAQYARLCSAAATRERVLVSHTVMLAVQEYLEKVLGVAAEPGRSSQLKFVELLDLADFRLQGWSLEVRAITSADEPALYVPIMPMLVGALADHYLAAQVNRSLTEIEVFGFACREDLSEAELSANGLFAILPSDLLRPFVELPPLLSKPSSKDPAPGSAFEEWQVRGERLLLNVSEWLTNEAVFSPEQIGHLAAGLRDEVLRVYGEHLPATGVEPLLEQLFRRFGMRRPVPAPPQSDLLFAPSAEEQTEFARWENRESYFQDNLYPAERASLYRYLLADEAALQEHRQMRKTLDRATKGKHLASPQRRKRMARQQQSRSVSATLETEPIAPDLLAALTQEREFMTGSPSYAPHTASNDSMNIFAFRDRLIADYASYVQSFIQIRNSRIRDYVNEQLQAGVFYPEPLIQLNPSFARGDSLDQLITDQVLHPECANIFRKDKVETISSGRLLNLHQHQTEAIKAARKGHNYVLTTGTGSGKSLSYIIPIVNHVLRNGTGRGIQAIVVYPMNALANSQFGELEKFLCRGYPDGPPVTFDKYTGQENEEERKRITHNPPDILLTNYVMLELILTRPAERKIIEAARGLRFLVLDELHTYRGRQGADVALLVRRVRDRLQANELQCVGTSATIAGGGTFEEQRTEVARVATRLFGAAVRPEAVIMETLRRTTPDHDEQDAKFVAELKQRLDEIRKGEPFARDYASFVNDPLAIWIESTLGVKSKDGRLVRCQPQSITGEEGAAKKLSDLTGIERDHCEAAIVQALLAGYECEKNPATGFAPFAFRLHQFISRGDTVYATLEDEAARYLTIYGQQYRPGSREYVLLPLVFCRECGQEYYGVRRIYNKQNRPDHFAPRQLNDQLSDQDSEAGFLYFSTDRPFPTDEEQIINENRVPDDWVEERKGKWRIRKDRQADLPRTILLGTDGVEAPEGRHFSYIAAPFRFCLCCGVTYGMRQRDDFAKLSSLGSEGRSTATTITSLSAIRSLRRSSLPQHARKLLSFTDNRQDASLQAGHFNDFIETTLLRSALYQAVRNAGANGISYDDLTGKAFDALQLPRKLYAKNPEEKFQHIKDTDRALREVIGYRLYRDLERGWRITMPNLEQCGLLRMEYQSLDELCAEESEWMNCHPALTTATSAVRQQIAKVLLDFMRRELTINVSYLDSREQERIKQQSNQRLVAPWAIDENEKLEYAGILFARSRKPGDPAENTYLSARGGFGQYLRRTTTFTDLHHRLDLNETETIIADLLRILATAGLVTKVVEEQKEEVAGYQLMASALRWTVSDGAQAFHDPIRMPNVPEGGGRTNPYFVNFYRDLTTDLQGLEAREHTAQVQYELREEREEKFKTAELPILYCSPTMELGVDITELNVVNMRNMPPTPANYAQRSGRAGRSGQPALVFTYCTTGSPHDQYFFKRPDLMVSGQVSPPRLDLANEDLVRAHVHAIWLAETGISLGKSLKEILDLSGEELTLALFESIKLQADAPVARQRASVLAEKMMATIKPDLEACDWYSEKWLDEVLTQATTRFDRTCDRWRDLYRSALKERELQNDIIIHHERSPQDKELAKRVRGLAESQIKLLTEVENVAQSDFYSYRYFASEGFLPGYNFPRLPVSAFIPARRNKQRDEFVSRPRFLAISEFGPRALVYHEGSKYVINKVILPISEGGDVLTQRAKLCEGCGYLHEITQGEGLDLCERCQRPLSAPLTSLFRLQNVSTRRRDKINSDEEERIRLGYEIITGVRFSEHAGQQVCRTAEVCVGDQVIARLFYGQAATLWRINLGWARRQNRNLHGFVLDVERGYWKSESDAATDDQEDPISRRTARVIPYVEDTRNCLMIEPVAPLAEEQMASLQAALKNAIQVQYQLEDNELAAEPLPTVYDRRLLLFYESAEGGAGVLRRMLEDEQALAKVAATALELCHYTIDGIDQRRALRAKEDCEAACYDCLMSYFNQREHRLLDRNLIRRELLQFANALVKESPTSVPRATHLEQLLQQCDSELERQWLRYLDENGHRLPSQAQSLIEAAQTRPDFLYREEQVAIYIDGPIHDFPERQQRDRTKAEWLEDQGYTVVRFAHDEEWDTILQKYPHIFGKPQGAARVAPKSKENTATTAASAPLDFDLFDPRFHPLVQSLAARLPDAVIEPGGDVAERGRVVGSDLAEVQYRDVRLRLLDAAQADKEKVQEALIEAGFDVFVVGEEQQEEAVEILTQILQGE